MIDWPDSFPCIIREEYELERINNLSSTNMESGMPRVRQTFESTPTLVSASFIATAAQGRAFELWYKHALKGGTEWFNAPLADPQSSTNTLVVPGLYNSRFMKRYSGPQLVGAMHWKYTMQLMAMPIGQFEGGDDWGLFPDYLTGLDLLDVIMNRDWPEA